MGEPLGAARECVQRTVHWSAGWIVLVRRGSVELRWSREEEATLGRRWHLVGLVTVWSGNFLESCDNLYDNFNWLNCF